jgi:hypothetical protein
MLVAFMHEEFGKEKVQSILTSSKPTFDKALTKALAIDFDGFIKKWNAWLKKKNL